MFCNKCGHKFDGNFCPKCGAKAKNTPEMPVNTTVNFSEDKDDNPYNVYYNEQPQQENVAQQPAQPPYQPYSPPYQVQPQKDKSLKWWQILLIVLAGVLLGFATSPASCISSMVSCDEIYLNEYEPYDTSINHKTGFIGETINSEYFSYTVTDAKYIKRFERQKPKEGYKFLEVTIKSVNTSSIEEYLSYELHCYADNVQYNRLNNEYYFDFGDLLPAKASLNTVVFEIPEDADSIELNLNDYCTSILIILNNIE